MCCMSILLDLFVSSLYIYFVVTIVGPMRLLKSEKYIVECLRGLRWKYGGIFQVHFREMMSHRPALVSVQCNGPRFSRLLMCWTWQYICIGSE